MTLAARQFPAAVRMAGINTLTTLPFYEPEEAEPKASPEPPCTDLMTTWVRCDGVKFAGGGAELALMSDTATFIGILQPHHVSWVAAPGYAPDRWATVRREVGRLVDGWDGPASRAPNAVTRRSLESIFRALPLGVRQPEIEVDGEDGAISLLWYAGDRASVFSLTAHESLARGVLTTKTSGSNGWREIAANDALVARRILQDPKIYSLVVHG